MEDIRRAWDARDPEVVNLVTRLAEQTEDAEPETPVREGAPTFARFLAEIHSKPFRRRPRAEQAHYRVEQARALEAPDAEAPLPERLKLHHILTTLREDNGPFARACLLAI